MGANIGFHGSSVKKDMRVIPAMILGLGGGVDPDGEGYIADKIIKIPTKRIPQLVRILLDDFQENALENEHFNKYYRRLGKHYFTSLFEPLADISTLAPDEYMDWGSEMPYFPAIGVGECAGVTLDLVSVIIEDAKSRLDSARENFDLKLYGEAAYLAYHSFIIAAKAMLLVKDVRCNTHLGIISDFQENYGSSDGFRQFGNFNDLVLQINKNQPGELFAKTYLTSAGAFLDVVLKERENQLSDTKDTLVIESYYKA
jgi:sulfite reductase (ferredoxin)